MFATSQGTVYAVAPTGMYRLTPDTTRRGHPSTRTSQLATSRMPMAEYNGTLYIVSADEIFTSNDSGETWNMLGPRPNGTRCWDSSSQTHLKTPLHSTDITMYLALRDEGMSSDRLIVARNGHPHNNGLTDAIISAVAAVGKYPIYAGTGHKDFIWLDSDIWKKLPD